MNKVLLVSNGLGAVPSFVESNPSILKLVFIPTGGNSNKDPWWVDRDRKALKQMGFQFSEFDIEGKNPHELAQALTNVDVVFVAGGNTFYLLDRMNKCGFAHRISILIDSGVKYIGGSAGAIVTGPDIEPIRILDEPELAPELKSTKGLGLVDFVVIPHVNPNERDKEVHQIKQDFGDKFKLVFISDEQAVEVDQYGVPKVVESK